MKRVLVCGGRYFEDSRLIYSTLDALHVQHNFSVVIHGDARGADRVAERWADSLGIRVSVYPALWERWGTRAGPIRNQLMLDQGRPDLVVAFPGGKGTAHMVRIAKEAGVEVVEVPYP